MTPLESGEAFGHKTIMFDNVTVEPETGTIFPVQRVAPLDIAPDVSIDAIPTLSWLSGTDPNIIQHVLYFSTDENWVNTALPTDAAAIVLPVTTETHQHDEPLAYETTYYWRVDEARGDVSVPANVDTGPVWSFTTEPGLGPIDVYLFAGQSNMQGVGYSIDLTSEQKSQPEIMLYHTSSVSSGQPANTWMTLMPAGWDGFGSGGCFGPEIGFGLKIAEHYPTSKIAFIKHAVGGSGISPDCDTSGWYPVYYPARPNADDQYIAFINAAHTALTELETMGYTPQIKGMLWMQGETDAMKISTANDYRANFTLLISKVRQEFSLPEMPVTYGQVFPHFTGLFPASFPGKDIVRQAQADMDQDSGHSGAVAGAHMVPTESCSVHSQIPGDPRESFDDLHFGSDGQLGLGQLFAEQFSPPPCAGLRFDGDIDGDCFVGMMDLMLLAQDWMLTSTDSLADINEDTNVDLGDFAYIGRDWQTTVEKPNMLFLSAHPDDECIFGGGTLPYYSQVKDVDVTLLAMVTRNANGHDPLMSGSTSRMQEFRNAVDVYAGQDLGSGTFNGEGHYITGNMTLVEAGLIDTGCCDGNGFPYDCWYDTGDGYGWGSSYGVTLVTPGFGNKDNLTDGPAVAKWVIAREIRRCQPEVVVSVHDLEGDYGHSNHIATVIGVIEAYELAADANVDIDGLDAWLVSKLYIRGDDWDNRDSISYTGFSSDGGINSLFHDHMEDPTIDGYSPRTVADWGANQHVSQGGIDVQTVYRTNQRFEGHHSEWWTLYRSTVGPDTLSTFTMPGDTTGSTYNNWGRGDFLENLED